MGKILGYKYIYSPNHPLANKSGIVYVHRIVASEKMGRLIRTNEVVHHIDGNRSNNNPENLIVMTRSKHARMHQGCSKEREPIECALCGAKTHNKKYCSCECSRIGSRVVKRPPKEQLMNEIATMT